MTQVVERREIALWQRDLESIFGRRHVLRPVGGNRFYGSVRTEQFGSITAVQLFTEAAVEVRRTVARSVANPFYYIFFVQGGETWNGGRDPAQRVPPSSMMLVSGNDWYRAQQSERFRSLILTIPAALMRSRLPDVDQRCGTIVSAHHGPARLLQDYAISLLAQSNTLSRGLRQRAQEHLLDLICDGAPNAATQDRDACVRAFIRTHLADPELSPTMAAQAMGVSVRTIHARMARSDMAFADYVRAQRLERCLADLVSTDNHARTITEIALRWGFVSSSTFSRQFRARFGLSPRAAIAAGIDGRLGSPIRLSGAA